MKALGFYLLAPFGIVVSQSFQTEAVMVYAFSIALWCLVPGWEACCDLTKHNRGRYLVCGLASLR